MSVGNWSKNSVRSYVEKLLSVKSIGWNKKRFLKGNCHCSLETFLCSDNVICEHLKRLRFFHNCWSKGVRVWRYKCKWCCSVQKKNKKNVYKICKLKKNVQKKCKNFKMHKKLFFLYVCSIFVKWHVDINLFHTTYIVYQTVFCVLFLKQS